MATNAVRQYQENEAMYRKISDELDKVRMNFENADRSTQKDILRTSSEFAILTVRVDVDRAEDVFARFQDTDTWREAWKLFQTLNGKNQKFDYITRNRTQADFGKIVDLLNAGEYAAAWRETIREVKGVGPRKASFTLAMCGKKRFMCIDTNVAQMAGVSENDDETRDASVDYDRYTSLCDDIRAQYPELDEELSPFVLQWVLFDANRGNISTHDPYFLVTSTEALV